jgi:hypothetical protein
LCDPKDDSDIFFSDQPEVRAQSTRTGWSL